jgi:hypothetical protein
MSFFDGKEAMAIIKVDDDFVKSFDQTKGGDAIGTLLKLDKDSVFHLTHHLSSRPT